jgi:hypothetical protein
MTRKQMLGIKQRVEQSGAAPMEAEVEPAMA